MTDDGSSTNGVTTYNVTATSGDLSNLIVGGTAVRISGGTLLLDASSDHSPFMDVIDEGTTVVRTGYLDGITSNYFGALTGK